MKVLSSGDMDRMLAYRDISTFDRLRNMSKEGAARIANASASASALDFHNMIHNCQAAVGTACLHAGTHRHLATKAV